MIEEVRTVVTNDNWAREIATVGLKMMKICKRKVGEIQ